MHPSDGFLHKLRKLRKQMRESGESDFEPRIREAFLASVPTYPAQLTEELFSHFYEKALSADTAGAADGGAAGDGSAERRAENRAEAPVSPVDRHFDRAEQLADLVDLLCEDYDEQTDPLDHSDWQVVRDTFSAHAEDLDMGTVNYIMRLVVDHKAT